MQNLFQQRQDQKRSDLDEQLKEYINEWRKQRAKEEDELKRLKEKQAKRKVTHISINVTIASKTLSLFMPSECFSKLRRISMHSI